MQSAHQAAAVHHTQRVHVQNPFSGSVEQHMNQSYHEALCAVVSAQLEARQRHADGTQGLLSLLRDLPVMREAVDKHARAHGIPFAQRMAQLVPRQAGSAPQSTPLAARWGPPSRQGADAERVAEPLTPESAVAPCGDGTGGSVRENGDAAAPLPKPECSRVRVREHVWVPRDPSCKGDSRALTAELSTHLQASLLRIATLQPESPGSPAGREFAIATIAKSVSKDHDSISELSGRLAGSSEVP